MYLMLQQEQPDDFVIATGKTISLSDFIAEAFGIL
jgi:GDPmannose 4,6-dehydratase